MNTDEVVKNAVTNVIASEVLGVDAEDIEAQKAAIRKQAEEAGNKLICYGEIGEREAHFQSIESFGESCSSGSR